MLWLALGCTAAAFAGATEAGLVPAKAQFRSSWTRIGGSVNSGDVYIKEGSIKTIRSVGFRNTTYRRGDFSYTDYSGITSKKRLAVDCNNSSYKNDDNDPGYFIDLTWITPFTQKNSIESIAYHYLCPEPSDPWVDFYETTGHPSKIYFINARTITESKNSRYGSVRSGIMVEGYKSSQIQSEVFMFYVACNQGLSGTRSMYTYMRPSNPSLNLTEDNPGSIGAGWSELLCALKL